MGNKDKQKVKTEIKCVKANQACANDINLKNNDTINLDMKNQGNFM